MNVYELTDPSGPVPGGCHLQSVRHPARAVLLPGAAVFPLLLPHLLVLATQPGCHATPQTTHTKHQEQRPHVVCITQYGCHATPQTAHTKHQEQRPHVVCITQYGCHTMQEINHSPMKRCLPAVLHLGCHGTTQAVNVKHQEYHPPVVLELSGCDTTNCAHVILRPPPPPFSTIVTTLLKQNIK